MQGFSLPGESAKAAKILKGFLGESGPCTVEAVFKDILSKRIC